jgi:phospholipid/cholesterol/gamma-HCH transport system substrate-binding protein
MSRTERRELLVGLLAAMVLGAVLFLSATANRRQAASDTHQFHLTADFGRADGIHVGSPVRLAGVPVGTVSAMDLNDHFRAFLTMRFDRPMQLPDDSSAGIQTDGLFGTKFVEVQPGGSEDLLKSGGRIAYTQDSVIIEELVALIVSRAKAARQEAAAHASKDETVPEEGSAP